MSDYFAGQQFFDFYISDADDVHRASITLIGNDVAKRFFAGVDPLGKSIYIDGEAYEVVGVAKEMGSAFGQSQDSFVYIPIQTWRKVYGSNTSMNINIKALAADLAGRLEPLAISGACPSRIRFPTGSSPRHCRRAIVSLTITTPEVCSLSSSVKLRPRTSGSRMVSK